MIALVALFILVPIAELYVILKVGEAIGAPLTIAILAADSVIGAMLMRSQSRIVWRRFQAAIQEGRVPHREVLDGVLVIFGGAFLITPGFLTDVVGLIFLLPPTRALARRVLLRGVGKRFTMFVAGSRRPPRDYDVDGTAYEHDPPRLER
jgi:UPF0716 protein FxsA